MTAAIPSTDSRVEVKKVLVVDDHPMMRAGVVELIGRETDMEVCGQADSVEGALELVAATRPDLLMLDLSLGDESSLYQFSRFKELMPALPILILSMHDEKGHGHRAILEGADGYISKDRKPEELLSAIRIVLEGGQAIPAKVLPLLIEGSRGRNAGLNDLNLSRREFEVYQDIGVGRATREIAAKLGIASRTVEAHKENMKKKLGLKTAAELAKHAAQYMQGGGPPTKV